LSGYGSSVRCRSAAAPLHERCDAPVDRVRYLQSEDRHRPRLRNFYAPDDFYLKHLDDFEILHDWLYRRIIRHWMNRRVDRI